MAREFGIEIDGTRYTGTTASAKDQFEALHIAMRTGLVASLKADAREMSKVAVFGGLQYADVQKIHDLLVKGRVYHGEVPVAENLFGDDIQNYYLLMYEVIRENIGGFWKLRRPTDEKQAAEPTP